MPTVPTYTRQVGIPGSTFGAKGSMGFASLLGEATAGIGESVTRAADQVLEARRVDQLSQGLLDAARDMDELDQWTDKQTEWGTLSQGYQDQAKQIRARYRTETSDPIVRDKLDKEIQRMTIRGNSRAVSRSLTLERQQGEARLQTALDSFADLAATASDTAQMGQRIGYARAAITGAVKAGTIDEAKGAELDRKFFDNAHVSYIKREILVDPKKAYEDLWAGKYAGLDEGLKADLLKYSKSMADAYEHQRIEDENRARLTREREIKEVREFTTANLTVFALEGKLTKRQIIDAGRLRLIESSDMITLENLIEKREGGIDDPATKLDVYTRILEGSAKPKDVLGAVGNGISTKTAIEFLDKLKTIQEDDVTKQVWYKQAKSEIEEKLKTTGVMSPFDPNEGPRTQNALNEFDARVRKGEDFRSVKDDVVDRYRPRPISPGELPRPVFGTKEDLGAAYKRTKDAYAAGEIDQATYEREIRNIATLLKIQDAEKPPTAAVKPPATDLKKSLKERKGAW